MKTRLWWDWAFSLSHVTVSLAQVHPLDYRVQNVLGLNRQLQGCVQSASDRTEVCSGRMRFSEYACRDLTTQDGTGEARSKADQQRHLEEITVELKKDLSKDLSAYFSQENNAKAKLLKEILKAGLPSSKWMGVIPGISGNGGRWISRSWRNWPRRPEFISWRRLFHQRF